MSLNNVGISGLSVLRVCFEMKDEENMHVTESIPGGGHHL